MSIMDRAITNKVGRCAWNRFLKEKSEFRIIKYSISYGSHEDKLIHLMKWLKLKEAKATSLYLIFVFDNQMWRGEKNL